MLHGLEGLIFHHRSHTVRTDRTAALDDEDSARSSNIYIHTRRHDSHSHHWHTSSSSASHHGNPPTVADGANPQEQAYLSRKTHANGHHDDDDDGDEGDDDDKKNPNKNEKSDSDSSDSSPAHSSRISSLRGYEVNRRMPSLPLIM